MFFLLRSLAQATLVAMSLCIHDINDAISERLGYFPKVLAWLAGGILDSSLSEINYWDGI